MIEYLSPVIGGIIGFFTNWLAIKMLFYPRKSVYIGKFHLPMTPGLIYKEQNRIAKKMGSVTTKYVLTPSSIRKNIKSEENISFLKAAINKNKETDLKTFLGDNYAAIKKIILLNLIQYLKKESTVTCLAEKLASLDIPINLFSIRKWLIEDGNGIKIQTEFIEKYKDKKISFFIHNNKNIIKNIIEKITINLNNYLTTNEKADKALRSLTHKIITENIGKIAGLFLNSDRIYENIRNNLSDYILSENGRAEILNFIENTEEMTVGKVIAMFSGSSSLIISEERMSAVITELETLNYSKSKEFETQLKNLVMTLYLKNIDIITEKAFDLIMKTKILKIFDLNPAFLDLTIDYLLDKLCSVVINNIDVAAIVENEINSFDMELLENVILTIVKKELNIITLTGGILGFVIGAFPLIYRLVYL